jgi:hypothetical protein
MGAPQAPTSTAPHRPGLTGRRPPTSCCSSSSGCSSSGPRASSLRSVSAPKPPTSRTLRAPSAPPTSRSFSNASPAAYSASGRSRTRSSATPPVDADPQLKPMGTGASPRIQSAPQPPRLKREGVHLLLLLAPEHIVAPPVRATGPPRTPGSAANSNGASPSSHTERHGRPRRADSPSLVWR